jgi:hypothetical protein
MKSSIKAVPDKGDKGRDRHSILEGSRGYTDLSQLCLCSLRSNNGDSDSAAWVLCQQDIPMQHQQVVL